MVSIFRWQQLQFDQCGIALALCWQVSSLKQGNHQLLLFLLILHSKTQAYSGATGLCPLTWLFRKLVQIWPQAAQWEPASSNRKSERECKWSRETKIKKKKWEWRKSNNIAINMVLTLFLKVLKYDLLPIVREPRWVCKCGCCSQCSTSSLSSGTAELDELLKLGGRKKGTSAKLLYDAWEQS